MCEVDWIHVWDRFERDPVVRRVNSSNKHLRVHLSSPRLVARTALVATLSPHHARGRGRDILPGASRTAMQMAILSDEVGCREYSDPI